MVVPPTFHQILVAAPPVSTVTTPSVPLTGSLAVANSPQTSTGILTDPTPPDSTLPIAGPSSIAFVNNGPAILARDIARTHMVLNTSAPGKQLEFHPYWTQIPKDAL